MLAEIMDIKDIYTVGDNLREIIGQDLSVFTGQNLVDWLLKNDRQVRWLLFECKSIKQFLEYA